MELDGNMPCLTFGNGRAVMKGYGIEGVPMMVICELAPEVTVKTGERVSEQQVRDSKEVLGLAFANKESIDVVIGWLNMIKDNYERLADPEQKEGESE